MQYIIFQGFYPSKTHLDCYKMMSIFEVIIDERKIQFPTNVTFRNTLLLFKGSSTKAWKAINARLQLILVA